MLLLITAYLLSIFNNYKPSRKGENIAMKKQDRLTFRHRKISMFIGFLALCVFAGWALFGCATAKPEESDPIIEQEYDPIIAEQEEFAISITGLPVELMNVTDSPDAQLSDHTAVGQLSGFFTYPINYSHARVNLFAFVRVLEIEPPQDATLQVLSTVWSRDVEIPETIQAFIGGNIVDPAIIREGGVYLLPLIHSEWNGSDLWIVRAPFNVLFEIDDNGRIWSHSPNESFNRFDGADASVVVDAILNITSDENFEAATATPFGYWAADRRSRRLGSLVAFTVLSANRIEGQTNYQLEVYIDEVLTSGSEVVWFNGDIVAILFPMPLEEGQQYLAFSHMAYRFSSNMAAKINEDGTIIAIPDAHDFESFNGLTAECMREIVERAKAWYDTHVK